MEASCCKFSSYMEGDECYTNEYKLCKALRELNEPAEKAEVVHVSGEAPEQNEGY